MAEREKDFLLPFFLISQQTSGFSVPGARSSATTSTGPPEARARITVEKSAYHQLSADSVRDNS